MQERRGVGKGRERRGVVEEGVCLCLCCVGCVCYALKPRAGCSSVWSGVCSAGLEERE